MGRHYSAYASLAIAFAIVLLSGSDLVSGDGLNDIDHHGSWAVSFHEDFDYAEENESHFNTLAQTLADKHGLINHGKILPGVYLFSLDCSHDDKKHCSQRLHRRDADMTDRLEAEEHIQWAEQQKPRPRQRRGLTVPKFTDPLFRQQWHLYNPHRKGKDSNVIPVWNKGITGKGVYISVIDDGLESDHSDLKGNFEPSCSYDFNYNRKDVTPRYKDSHGRFTSINNHGTRCAGVIAGGANNSCGVGVAYESKVCGIKIIDGNPDDRMEANAFSYGLDVVDIFSSSWGPNDDGRTVEGPLRLAKRALVYGVERGRKGKGAIYVFASGNGGSYGDDCNCDGYTNSIFTLTIGSIDINDGIPHYAESCASHFAVTYSSSRVSGQAIATCDIRGQCTSRHSGTSASAPMAAGMIALALQANPDLTYRDVQHVVVNSAKPLTSMTKDWIINGAGRKFHNFFGFGLMDAEALVSKAKQWSNVGPSVKLTSGELIENKKIRKSSYESFSVEIKSHRKILIEHIEAVITIDDTNRGSIKVFLISPSGTKIQLLRTRHADLKPHFRGWTLTSTGFWDEPSVGKWTLVVGKDFGTNVFATMKEWSLNIYGRADSETNENLPSPSAEEQKEHQPNISKAEEVRVFSTISQQEAGPAPTPTTTKRLTSTDLPISSPTQVMKESTASNVMPKTSEFPTKTVEGQQNVQDIDGTKMKVSDPATVEKNAKAKSENLKSQTESLLSIYVTVGVVGGLIVTTLCVTCCIQKEKDVKSNYNINNVLFNEMTKELLLESKKRGKQTSSGRSNIVYSPVSGDDLEAYNINDSYYASNQFFRDRSKRRESGSSLGSSMELQAVQDRNPETTGDDASAAADDEHSDESLNSENKKLLVP